jgi:hypothetical protein
MLKQIWSLDQAQPLALKAERLVRTRKASKAPLTHREAPSRSHSPRVEEKTPQTKARQPTPKEARSKSRA